MKKKNILKTLSITFLFSSCTGYFAFFSISHHSTAINIESTKNDTVYKTKSGENSVQYAPVSDFFTAISGTVDGYVSYDLSDTGGEITNLDIFTGSVIEGDIKFNAPEGYKILSLADGFLEGYQNVYSLDIVTNLEYLGNNFLRSCTSLAALSFAWNTTCENIGDNFLYGCSSLMQINRFPEWVRYIGNNFCDGCLLLSELTIPRTVISIGEYFCNQCWTLSILDLSSTGITAIPNYFANDCKSAAIFSFPSSLMTIGDCFLFECNVVSEINIPSSQVVSFGDTFLSETPLADDGKYGQIFVPYFCLTSYLNDENWSTVNEGNTIQYITATVAQLPASSVFNVEGVDADISGSVNIKYTNETSIIIADTDNVILSGTNLKISFNESIYNEFSAINFGNNFLSGFSNITEVNFENCNLSTTIGNNFLANNYLLKSVVLPNTIVTIGANFLYDCLVIKKVMLPQNTKSVDENFCHGCVSLQYILFASDSVLEFGDDFLSDTKFSEGTDRTAQIFVPSYMVDQYQASEDWINVYGGLPLTFVCGRIIQDSEDVFTLNGTVGGVTMYLVQQDQKMTDISTMFSTFYGNFLTIEFKTTGIMQDKKIISLGNDFISNCSTVVNVILPDSINVIGNDFLVNDVHLTQITLPKKIQSVGKNFLAGCAQIAELYLPTEITSVGENFLFECTSLSKLVITATAVLNISSYFLFDTPIADRYSENSHIVVPTSIFSKYFNDINWKTMYYGTLLLKIEKSNENPTNLYYASNALLVTVILFTIFFVLIFWISPIILSRFKK